MLLLYMVCLSVGKEHTAGLGTRGCVVQFAVWNVIRSSPTRPACICLHGGLVNITAGEGSTGSSGLFVYIR